MALLTQLRKGTFMFTHMFCVCKQSKNINSYSVVITSVGKPENVLSGEVGVVDVNALHKDEVLVRMIAAPVNPVDINVIGGNYGHYMLSTPVVAGYEGVGKVEAVGMQVKNFKVGDLVVRESIQGEWWGTWRTIGICPSSQLRRIPADIEPAAAAMLSVNMCTAYRLMKDFANLQTGDVIIQNAANSSVGQLVMQLANKQGLTSVNVVRCQSNFDMLESKLKSLGASIVLTDSELASRKGREVMKIIKKPKLALNCVAGKSAADLVRYLDHDGTLVTYGGMSKEPNLLPTGPLIFQNVSMHGFSIAYWNKKHRLSRAQDEMWDDLCNILRQKALKLPDYEQFDIKDYRRALQHFNIPSRSKKQLLTMNVW